MDLNLTVMPCTFEDPDYGTLKAVCKVIYDGKKKELSITGTVRKSTGYAILEAGQILDTVRKGVPAERWTQKMLEKFCDIWDEWHLNSIRPYCEHQKALGWDIKAREKVPLYSYTLTGDARKQKRAAEDAALDALRHGRTFTPTAEQVHYANLRSKTLWDPLPEDDPDYKPTSSDWGIPPVEEKALGWLTPEEHPDGLLGRKCPVCGYAFGTGQIHEDVPEDVLEWLACLPSA